MLRRLHGVLTAIEQEVDISSFRVALLYCRAGTGAGTRRTTLSRAAEAQATVVHHDTPMPLTHPRQGGHILAYDTSDSDATADVT